MCFTIVSLCTLAPLFAFERIASPVESRALPQTAPLDRTHVEKYTDGSTRLEEEQREIRAGVWVPHGRYKAFYPDHVKDAEGTNDNGRKQGHWTFWFPNAKLEAEGDYVSGRIAVRYYVPDYDAQPTVTKTFSIK